MCSQSFENFTLVLKPLFNKRKLQHRCFLVEFAKFLGHLLLQNIYCASGQVFCRIVSFNVSFGRSQFENWENDYSLLRCLQIKSNIVMRFVLCRWSKTCLIVSTFNMAAVNWSYSFLSEVVVICCWNTK